MEQIRRAFASRACLTILVFLFMLVPAATIDVAWASDPDSPRLISQEATSKIFVDPEHASTGFTLIAPYNKRSVYLVDHEGVVIHTWQSNHYTTGTVILLEDGTLMRGRSGLNGQPDGVHLLDWDGSVLWDYAPSPPFRLHHDIEPLPNGNILLNAWVDVTYSEAVALGRDPDNTPAILPVEPILEIEPNGTKGGDIVWMWDPLDHIIQDYDPSKPNYGVVKDHPELIDINYPRELRDEWQHSNSVAYNAELDQVMITDRNFDEFWVIDHDTTTAEAAGHTGGANGRGGDLLYRWGNPSAYGMGNASNHILYGPHDAHWIGPGIPGEGNVIVFNNGVNALGSRPEGRISSVEELVLPINSSGGYDLDQGSAYGPSDSLWRYTASPPESFCAWSMGGVERLPNGNTLMCGGSTGNNFEVDEDNEVVWTYRSGALFQMRRYYPPALDEVTSLEAIEDVELRVDISPFISDLDTDENNILLDVRSPFTRVDSHELILLYPDGIRTDELNLTVSDGIFEVGRKVHVNIRPVNDPPILASIPTITAIEAVPFVLDLGPYIWDPDTGNDAMNIAVNSSYVTVKGVELGFLYPNGVLADRVFLRVSDGEFEAWTEILVNVTPVNDPPIAEPIPVQSGFEDVPWTVDLRPYIWDIDTPLNDISVVSTSRYAKISGLNLSLLYPEGVTRDVVYLTISDGKSYTFTSFNVTVEPVNDPPEIGDLPPLNVTEDEPFLLDVGPSIFDIDNSVDELTLRVDSPFVVVENHTLVLLYPDGVFLDEVVIQVWDGDLHASTTLVVVVVPINDPTVLKALPPLIVTEDEPFTLDLGPSILDIDTPTEELTLSVSSQFVDVEGLLLILLYPDGVTRDEVVVQVWDGEYRAKTTLVVTVEQVNDPPWWTETFHIAAVEDVEGEFDLAPFMNDIDTSLEELEVKVTSSFGSMEGHVFRFSYPDGVLSEEVTFTLSDGEFQAVLDLRVIVTPVNDAPELSGARVDPLEDSAGTSFIFTVAFKDIDMGSDVPVVEVLIDGVRYSCARDEMDQRPYKEGAIFSFRKDLDAGVHSFHFAASDGDGGVATTEPLTVVVRDMPGSNEETDLTPIWIYSLIIIAVVLVAVLLVGRRRLSGFLV